MKKLIILFSLFLIASVSLAQDSKEKYKDYKPCTECFDKWKKSDTKTGLESYGISAPSRRDNYAKQQLRRTFGWIGGIFVAAFTLAIINKSTNIANEVIH